MSRVINVSTGMKGKVQKTAVRAALLSALETVVLRRRQEAELMDGGDGKIKKNKTR